MMTNLETFTEKLLQIVLVGQPELEQRLKQPQLRQLRQRLTLRAKTHPFNLEETKSYIVQRLRIAGRRRADFRCRRHRRHFPLFAGHSAHHQPALRALPGQRLVDQSKTVSIEVVDSVARDFDLADGNAAAAMTAPAAPSPKS